MKLYYILGFIFSMTTAFVNASCLNKFEGVYGVKEIPRNKNLEAEESKRLATYDGFPFLVTHYYLRDEATQQSSIPKNIPLFKVTKHTDNQWVFEDIIPDNIPKKEKFWGLNATGYRDLDQVNAVKDGLSCYLTYGDSYRLAYIDMKTLNNEQLLSITERVNATYNSAFTVKQMKEKQYFLIGSLSSQGVGGEYPFSEFEILFPVDKLK